MVIWTQGKRTQRTGELHWKIMKKTDEDLKENRNGERREGNSTDHIRQETKNIRIGLIQK